MSIIYTGFQILIAVFAVGKSIEKTNTSIQNQEPVPNATKIAFGSCSRETSSKQLWQDIVHQNPDLWIWLGDNIYGDTQNMQVLASKYKKQKSHPDYQELRKTTSIIGTWDDHDYGVNDGGKYYSKKKESKNLLLDFLDVEANAHVREREGVYCAYDYGSGTRQVKVILLDTRYFRDTLDTDPSGKLRYLPNHNRDILGEDQWQWLKEQLTQSKAAVNIIGSSIQVIAKDHGWEKWANFPKSRERLFNLVAQSKARGVIFISGDRHIAEISLIERKDINYPLYDFTSSGLTHTWGSVRKEQNQFRVGDLVIKRNFGLIIIEWEKRPEITFQVRGEADSLFLEHKTKL